MKTIQKGWDNYRAAVIPKDAGDLQVSECRLAFYAGSVVMFSAFFELIEEGVSNDAALQMLVGYDQELKAFGKAVVAGKL